MENPMKKTLIFIFLITAVMFSFGQEVSDVSDLGITGEYYDIRSDNNGAVHILWRDGGWMKYGQIVNRQVVNQETIPVLNWGEVNYVKFRPRLAVKPDGTSVHFTWVTPASGPRTVRHCWRNSSGSWAVEDLYTTSTRYVQYPAITVDSTGMVHATFISWVSSSDHHPVHYFRKPAGGGWAQESNLAASDAKHLWCTLYTDSSGNVHASWDRNKQAVQYRYAASGGNLANSSTWTLPTTYGRNKESEVAVDSLGNVHVAAMAYDDPGLYVGYDYWYKPAGGSFQSPLRASDADFKVMNYFGYPAILGETQNMVAVSWAEPLNGYAGDGATIRVATYNGSGWTHYTFDTTADFKTDTRTAMAKNSTTAFMVWRNGNDTLSLATLDFATSGILSPNGGEEWKLGTTHEISWTLEDATGTLDIHLYKNGVDLGPIVSDYNDSSSPGSYIWTIDTLQDGTPIDSGNDYKVEVKATNGSDSSTSASNFTLLPTLTVTSPSTGNTWEMGTTQSITWNPVGTQDDAVKITLYDQTDATLVDIMTLNTPNDGSYEWVIPAGEFPADNYIVRVKTTDNSVFDSSDIFAVSTGEATPPAIAVTSPASGTNWTVGTTQSITWDITGNMASTVKITLYNAATGAREEIMTMSTPNDGSYSWTIRDTIPTGNYYVRVKTTDNAIYDNGDVFAITSGGSSTPVITVTSPVSGNNWVTGTTHEITWNRSGTMPDTVKITLYDSTGTNLVETMTMNTPNDGSYNWTVPASVSAGNYVVRVKTTDNAYTDDSDVLSVSVSSSPLISVTSPDGGEEWAAGSSQTINWAATGSMAGSVKITLYDPPGKNLISTLILNTANDGSYNWSVPTSIPSGHYRVRVKTTDNAVFGESDIFYISGGASPSIVITSPGFEYIWARGTSESIVWTVAGSQNNSVKITLYDSTGLTLMNIMTLNTPNDGNYTWSIPTGLAPGDYIVRVKTIDNAVYDNSFLVTITD